MHVIRFVTAVVLVELVVLCGVSVERKQLQLRKAASELSNRIRAAGDQRAEHLLRIGQLSSAARIAEFQGLMNEANRTAP